MSEFWNNVAASTVAGPLTKDMLVETLAALVAPPNSPHTHA